MKFKSYFKSFGATVILLIVGAVVDQNAIGADLKIMSATRHGGNLVISASVPENNYHAVLEVRSDVTQDAPQALAAGALDGEPSIVTFTVPDSGGMLFLTVRAGEDFEVPNATHSGAAHFSFEHGTGGLDLTEDQMVGHVLNRLAYGPSPSDRETVMQIGAAAYIEQQLDPASIDEENNVELTSREVELIEEFRPGNDTALIGVGETWRYFKGTSAPPFGWNLQGFNESAWLTGPTGIGYGDDDDETVLEDMRQTDGQTGYLTVYMRKTFTVSDLGDIDGLVFRVDFDDGFVAYLNGREIVRENVEGPSPTFDQEASGLREAGTVVEYDLSDSVDILQTGTNVLAIQSHNYSIDSSDLSMIPELVSREFLPGPPVTRIKGIDELQQLVHVRGIYAKRQLQAVLAEFWENHFTTDCDKVEDYFDDLDNSDAQDAMSGSQAELEAAQAEFTEYQFFYDNALGNFGDLLLYSATSPTQLIYLDNVLNTKEGPNENYAREILELFAFGVDNRYTQTDIEELAKCFTGWTVRKVWPEEKKPFPESATNPPTEESVMTSDEVILDIGPGWRYVKGTMEPTPVNGQPTTLWTEPDFNDAGWLVGATSIGYGDDDDSVVLEDMRGNYPSIYLRRLFTIENTAELDNLVLSIDYDDGFVAYLNGTEIARSRTMREQGSPPSFDTFATGNHEAGRRVEDHSLKDFLSLLKPAPQPNVLAIQVHNTTLNSSDLSIHPKLISRDLLPGSIENGNPNGLWAFRFNPDDHDIGPKTLFADTGHQMNIPAGRTGILGLRDATDVIEAMVDHPSTSEFICIKLINKFVCDDITLETYKDGSAPEKLRDLLDKAIGAWNSTSPAGNIATVMRAILDPENQQSYFWSSHAYRGKVKTPVEFINSSLRALECDVSGTDLPEYNEEMGMFLFTRDEPDGWSEFGFDWISTSSLVERIGFVQRLGENRDSDFQWDTQAFLDARQLVTSEDIVDHFDDVLFNGTLSDANRTLLIRFAETSNEGEPEPLDPARRSYTRKVEQLVGLILSMPHWHYQ